MKKILTLLAASLLLLPAFGQSYEPGNLKPGDYIIISKANGSLMVIDGGLRNDGFSNKDMRVIKDRVIGVVASVKGSKAVVMDLKHCPSKKVFCAGESKDHTFPTNQIQPLKWAHERFNQLHMDCVIPSVAEAESFHYKAIQHSLQQLIDAGRTDVELLHSDSDYWTREYSRPDYPKAYAWYHYKGRIKTHLRDPLAKLFVRACFYYTKK